MNRIPQDRALLFAQVLSDLQEKFADAYAQTNTTASKRLNLGRIRQLQEVVQLSAPSCQRGRGNLLAMARTAQDAVPVTPLRRSLNEYFAVFVNSVEPGFLAPPPMIQALTPAQKALLRQQVADHLAELEGLVAAERSAPLRAHYLQEAYLDAMTITHGAHADVREIELRLIACHLEAFDPEAATRQLQSFIKRFGVMRPDANDTPHVTAALRRIADHQVSMCRLIERAAGSDEGLGVMEGAWLCDVLIELERSLAPAAHMPPEGQPNLAQAPNIFDFTDLRRCVDALPAQDSLRKRVKHQLQIFDSSPQEQQTNSGIMLLNLAKLPPLRVLQPIAHPSAATAEERNALRAALRREFEALVVGHVSEREQIIESIIATLERRGSKGWTIILCGAPGVGKNTIAKAIARALNREFVEVNCAGRTKSEEILGTLKAFVGSEPGVAANILMTQTKAAVILWDEIGKAQAEVQNCLNTITDGEVNAKVRDNYFATVDLDFSDAIHVMTYNTGESIVGSLLRRGTSFALKDLKPEDKEEILRRAAVANAVEIFGAAGAVTVPEVTLKLLLCRRSADAGVGQLLQDLRAVMLQARRVQDGNQAIDAISPEIAMELLDGARSDTRLVGQAPDLALISDLTALEGAESDARPDELVWHVAAGHHQWRVTIKEEGCSLKLVSNKPFLGIFGVAVVNESNAVESQFIDPLLRKFNSETTIDLPAARFVDCKGAPQQTALEEMRQNPIGKRLRLAVRFISPNLSGPQALRQLRSDLSAPNI